MQFMDINLLPRQERSGSAFKAVSLTLVALALLGTIGLGILYFITEQSLSVVSRELVSTKKVSAAMQQNLANGMTDTTASAGLSTMLATAKQFPLPTVDVAQRIAGLLPQRGFILDYQFSDTSVSLTAQFDTMYETSTFLNALNESEWVSSVDMGNVSMGDKEAAGAGSADLQTVPRHTATFKISLNLEAITAKEGQEKR